MPLSGQGDSMKSRFGIMVKVLTFCLPLAMTFGIVACSDDDNGTGPSEGGSNSNGNGENSSIVTDVKVGTCDFKKDDKVWKFAFTVEQQGITNESVQFFIYDGKKSRDSLYAVSKGKNVATACKYTSGKTTDESEDDGVKVVTTTWCKGDDMYSTEVRSGGDMAKLSRDEAFNAFMKECKMLNQGADALDLAKSSSSGKTSSAKSSSSTKTNTAKSSSSAKTNTAKSSSSGKAENPFKDMQVGKCDFKIGDKVWKFVTYSNLLGEEYRGYFYEFKEGSYIDSTHTISLGAMAKTVCGYSGSSDTTYTDYGVTYHIKNWCTDDGAEDFETQKGVYETYTREEAFSDFMDKCEMFKQ